MQTETTFRCEFTVRYGDCDSFDRMLPSALLKEAQQAAMEHLDSVGLGLRYLTEKGLGFVLSRQQLRVLRWPKGGQRIRVFTSPGCCGPIYPRTTQFFDEKGDLMAELLALWALIDLKQRRILRRGPQELMDFFPILAKLPAVKRLPQMEEPDLTRTFCIPYFMTDTNGHLNNASYADLVAELLQGELLQGKTVAFMDLCYHSECRMGEELLLRRSLQGETVLIDGSCENRRSFECLIELK